MRLRAVTDADLPALTELQAAFDTRWFGAPEHDADEVRESIELAESGAVALDGDRVVGVAIRMRTSASIVADPRGELGEVYRLLVNWLGEQGAPEIEALERDERLRAALTGAGWSYRRSAFDLSRAVSDGWRLPPPQWPSGIEVRPFVAGDEAAVYEMVYRDAGWAEVDGHHERDLDEWRRLFLAGRPPAEAPVLALRDGRIVGAAVLRTFSDGMGWLAQLAVARSERGAGLGAALLRAGFGQLLAGGATQLGLSVMATNRAALNLYLSLGLEIDREWQSYAPSGPA